MKPTLHWLAAIGYGLVVWAVPFTTAMVLLPWREPWRSLFESAMAVTLVLVVTGLAIAFFRHYPPKSAFQGLALGVSWALISIAFDLPLMLGPPVNMGLTEYLADIGLTYLAIPAITTGIAFARRSAQADFAVPIVHGG
jgi:signal transduction histidine kinase